jgi:hypothetical protein
MITIEQLRERVEKARRHVIFEVPMAQASAVKMGIFFTNQLPTAGTDGNRLDSIHRSLHRSATRSLSLLLCMSGGTRCSGTSLAP